MRFTKSLAAALLLLPSLAAAQSRPIGPPKPAALEAAPVPAPALPYATNRRSFFIPVTVDRSSRDHVPVEVHLLVSADQGKNWSTFARQSAETKGFQFQGRDDGEYWFASRTLDAQGVAKPVGNDITPELRIIIDATPPKIELDAAAVQGDVKIAWRISDTTAIVEGVRLEYQAGEPLKPVWKNVPIPEAAQKPAGNMLLGSMTFQPQGSSRAVDLRLIVQDRAGNIVADSKRVFLPKAANPILSKLPEWSPLPVAAKTPVANTPQARTIEAMAPNLGHDPFTARQFSVNSPASPPQVAEVPGNAAAPAAAKSATSPSSTGTIWPSDNTLRGSSNAASFPLTPHGDVGPLSPQAPLSSPVVPLQERSLPTNPPASTGPAAGDKLAMRSGSLPLTPLQRESGATLPSVADRVIATPSSTGGANSPLIWPSDAARDRTSPAVPGVESPAIVTPRPPLPPFESIPTGDASPRNAPATSAPLSGIAGGISPGAEGERPQLSSSKAFSLDYDLDSVGPSGVRAVELWVTTDGGRTWDKWGEDDDKRSPFEIEVQSERSFGFRMVIVANNGLATRSPEPGDSADIWVTVDSTKPRAVWQQAAYGNGEHSGQLDLRWQADDEHLGARPVTISFAETAAGPYTILAAGLPNSGQYFWTVDPRTPRQIYLRLEVRDDAGNVTVDQTAEPVSLEGLSPRGRIRAVVPTTHGAAMHGAFRSPLFR